MKQERRWLKSVIVASNAPMPSMPWDRGARRRPEAMKSLAPVAVQPIARAAIAAR